jgi:sigma-B regulation protein RsbU (phosphoserine phosphatase)
MLSLIENQMATLERRLFDLENRISDQSAQLNDVATMGLMITSLIDIEKVLAAMMEMATRMVSGEVGCIMLLEKDTLQTKISWGLDDRIVQSIKMENDVDIATWTSQTGETIIINEFPESLEAPSERGMISAIISLPVATHEKQIGVLIIVNKTTGGGFTEEDRTVLETLVRFAAVAIENATLLKERLERQKLEQELMLARQVQQALLPAKSVSLDHAVIGATYLPAGQVGGDYYDTIRLSAQEFVIIVGDVSNKGMPAALMMAAIRSVFRMETGKNIEIAQLMTDLNSFLCDQVLKTENMFISLTYAYFNLRFMSCTFVNAGHLPPIHYHPDSQTLSLWKTGGVVLGQFPGFEYQSETVSLKPGDKVLFYTDGISECENPEMQMFGRERLNAFFLAHASLKPDQFIEALTREVESFAGGADKPQSDDITTLLIEIT